MLWTVILTHTASAMAIGRIDRRSSNPQSPKYRETPDNVNTTLSSYIGNFTNDVIVQIQKSDHVDQSGFLKPRNVRDYVSRKTQRWKSTTITEVKQLNPGWHLSRISQRKLSKFWMPSFRFLQNVGAGVDIYIIDTGVNDHVEFKETKLSSGPIVRNNEDDSFVNLMDADGHGTCVASLAVGRLSGVAKKSQVYSVKVMYPNGNGYVRHTTKAISMIKDIHTMRLEDPSYQGSVINISLGNSEISPENDEEQKAINVAIDSGIHVVVAAGNERADACSFTPASNPNVITVGASSKTDSKAQFTNYGKCVDVYAPGEEIKCASNKDKKEFVKEAGTSFSCPIVAGIVAGILSYAPYSGTTYTKGTQISPADMKTLIKRIATPITSEDPFSIAYFGGTEAELNSYYKLLKKNLDVTQINAH